MATLSDIPFTYYKGNLVQTTQKFSNDEIEKRLAHNSLDYETMALYIVKQGAARNAMFVPHVSKHTITGLIASWRKMRDRIVHCVNEGELTIHNRDGTRVTATDAEQVYKALLNGVTVSSVSEGRELPGLAGGFEIFTDTATREGQVVYDGVFRVSKSGKIVNLTTVDVPLYNRKYVIALGSSFVALVRSKGYSVSMDNFIYPPSLAEIGGDHLKNDSNKRGITAFEGQFETIIVAAKDAQRRAKEMKTGGLDLVKVTYYGHPLAVKEQELLHGKNVLEKKTKTKKTTALTLEQAVATLVAMQSENTSQQTAVIKIGKIMTNGTVHLSVDFAKNSSLAKKEEEHVFTNKGGYLPINSETKILIHIPKLHLEGGRIAVRPIAEAYEMVLAELEKYYPAELVHTAKRQLRELVNSPVGAVSVPRETTGQIISLSGTASAAPVLTLPPTAAPLVPTGSPVPTAASLVPTGSPRSGLPTVQSTPPNPFSNQPGTVALASQVPVRNLNLNQALGQGQAPTDVSKEEF